MRHIIPISGKDSLATALFMNVHEPREYEFFYNDNGAELPETYAWLDKVESKKVWNITRVGSDLTEIIRGEGFLPSPKKRYCTRKSKIEPMENWIGSDEAVIYYGLRFDESRVGYRGMKKNITARIPLHENRIDIRGVWAIVSAAGLLPPSFEWPALYKRVQEKEPEPAGGYEKINPWQRHILFSGRTRPNCFYCFYQRQYEYVWLYDTHPDLFEKACRLEREVGAEGYTWRQGYSLSELIQKREQIIERRADEIVQIILKRRQNDLFGDAGDTELALTSCGLLCGK